MGKNNITKLEVNFALLLMKEKEHCKLILFSFLFFAQNLSKLTKLKTLSIQSNRITKIENLEDLINLEELYLAHNGLEKIEGLEKNVKLTTLDIGGNRIKVIEGLDHLSLLEEFWANDNQIASLAPLESQLGPLKCPNLNTVYLEGNPAQRSEGSSYRTKIRLSLPQISQIDAT